MVRVSSEREPQVKGLKVCVSAIIMILERSIFQRPWTEQSTPKLNYIKISIIELNFKMHLSVQSLEN